MTDTVKVQNENSVLRCSIKAIGFTLRINKKRKFHRGDIFLFYWQMPRKERKYVLHPCGNYILIIYNIPPAFRAR